jgi:hypothetical protein
MGSSNLTWIQTRDGSPTLWSNDLGESFRSVKGAFTESWTAFVEPALRYQTEQTQQDQAVSVLAEFGLGAGTNWALWNLGLKAMNLPAPTYVAIEKDLSAFELGLRKFIDSAELLEAFMERQFTDVSLPSGSFNKLRAKDISRILTEAPRPIVCSGLDETLTYFTQTPQNLAQIWFHDPFGFDINPEGYSAETLQKISTILAPTFWGASYACNRYFQKTLQVIPAVNLRKIETGNIGLKRERLEFFRNSISTSATRFSHQ